MSEEVTTKSVLGKLVGLRIEGKNPGREEDEYKGFKMIAIQHALLLLCSCWSCLSLL